MSRRWLCCLAVAMLVASARADETLTRTVLSGDSPSAALRLESARKLARGGQFAEAIDDRGDEVLDVDFDDIRGGHEQITVNSNSKLGVCGHLAVFREATGTSIRQTVVAAFMG